MDTGKQVMVMNQQNILSTRIMDDMRKQIKALKEDKQILEAKKTPLLKKFIDKIKSVLGNK